MIKDEVKREILPNGDVRLSSADCAFVFSRPRPGVLVARITGDDGGQFGTRTLDEIASAIAREGPLELFVDARDALGPAVSVSEDWTRFFSKHRANLRRVHVLAGSKVVSLTVTIAQHLSRTGDLIQIYSDSVIFESRLALALGTSTG